MKGTIRQRTNKDGSISWICEVELPRDPVTQKRRFKSSVASTKREAHSLVHAMLAELDSATRVDQVAATSQTVGRLIERWLEVAGPAAPSTRSVYAGYIKNQIRPHLWEIRLDRLGVADLDCWYVTLRKNGLKPASIRKAHTIVRAALAQGVRWGWTSVNVAAMARPPVVPKPVIVTPKAVDVKHLVAVVDETDPEFATYIRLAGVTGARPGELCALQWGDVDFATGELFVRRRVMRSDDGMFVEDLTKTGKVRRIPLDPSTLARLREHRQLADERAAAAQAKLGDGGCVFSSSVDGTEFWRPDSVSRRFRAFRNKAGWGASPLYALRHLAATTMIDAGVDPKTASDRLGNSVATILSTYTRGRTEADVAAANLLGSMFD